MASLNYSQADITNAKIDLMGIFKPFQGAAIPQKMIGTQFRFSAATNINLGSERLSFYPNYFVTPQIFQTIQGYIRSVDKK